MVISMDKSKTNVWDVLDGFFDVIETPIELVADVIRTPLKIFDSVAKNIEKTEDRKKADAQKMLIEANAKAEIDKEKQKLKQQKAWADYERKVQKENDRHSEEITKLQIKYRTEMANSYQRITDSLSKMSVELRVYACNSFQNHMEIIRNQNAIAKKECYKCLNEIKKDFGDDPETYNRLVDVELYERKRLFENNERLIQQIADSYDDIVKRSVEYIDKFIENMDIYLAPYISDTLQIETDTPQDIPKLETKSVMEVSPEETEEESKVIDGTYTEV